MQQKTTKIFTAHHKEFIRLQDSVLTPIHVGSKISHNNLDIIRDDSGDNISELNPYFCELTAHYWAWKNDLNYDYIGITHYRRLFNFNENIHKSPNDTILHDSITILNDKSVDEFKDKYGLTEIAINKYINSNPDIDIFLQTPETMSEPIQDQFHHTHYKKGIHLDQAIDILLDKYPEYQDTVHTFLKGNKLSLFNMFIMQRGVFNDYSSWLFDILFELHKHIDYTHLTTQSKRECGHVAERLLNIYILHNHLKQKNIDVIQIEQVQEKLSPETDDCVPVVLACNDKYVPYAMVLIQSISDHIKTEKIYEILILANNITEQSIFLLNQMSTKQVIIKILHMDDLYEKNKDFSCDSPIMKHGSIDTYSRMFIPDLLSNYKKILYLDIDIICLVDVAEFLDIELHGNLVGAVSDYIGRSFVKSQQYFDINGKSYKFNDYVLNYLGIDNVQNYFQAGVMIFNIAAMQQMNFLDEIIKLRQSKDFLLLEDQDLLNMYFNTKVEYMNMSWNLTAIHNAMATVEETFFPDEVYEYHVTRPHVKIIHFQGPLKPWDEEGDLTYLWWFYADKLGILKNKKLGKNILHLLSIRHIKKVIVKDYPMIYHLTKKPYRVLRNLYRKIKGNK